MHRRFILTGALAAATAPAWAQSNPAPPTDAPAAPAPTAPAAEPAPAPAMKMATPLGASDAATAHIKGTLTVGSLSLAASRLAVVRVKHPQLRQFVDFEIAEQETIAGILKELMTPGAPPMGLVRPPTETEVLANLDPKGKAALDALRETKTGPAFERDYLKAQIDGHRTLLEIQEAYLKVPSVPEETTLAKLAKGMITEHLTLLADIERQLG